MTTTSTTAMTPIATRCCFICCHKERNLLTIVPPPTYGGKFRIHEWNLLGLSISNNVWHCICPKIILTKQRETEFAAIALEALRAHCVYQDEMRVRASDRWSESG